MSSILVKNRYKNSKDFKDCKIQLKNTGINDFIELEHNSFMGPATARSLRIRLKDQISMIYCEIGKSIKVAIKIVNLI